MLRQAKAADYAIACDIYRAACEGMERAGLDLWHWGQYPSAEIVEEDVREGWLYLWEEEGEILGCIALNHLGDPAYEQITWQHEGKVGFFHRVAVSPLSQGKGIARRMMQNAQQILRDQGYTVMRGDVSRHNLKAIALYTKSGFCQVGKFHADWCEAPDVAWGLEMELVRALP